MDASSPLPPLRKKSASGRTNSFPFWILSPHNYWVLNYYCFLYVYVCSCFCVWANVYVCVCMCEGLVLFLDCDLPYYRGRIFQSNPELSSMPLALLASFLQGSLPLPSMPELQIGPYIHLTFAWVLGIQTLILLLAVFCGKNHRKNHWTIYSALDLVFFTSLQLPDVYLWWVAMVFLSQFQWKTSFGLLIHFVGNLYWSIPSICFNHLKHFLMAPGLDAHTILMSAYRDKDCLLGCHNDSSFLGLWVQQPHTMLTSSETI